MIYAVVFIFGAAGYGLLEMLWRGYTHWTMLFAGGLCFCAVYFINNRFSDAPVVFRCMMCAIAITAVELVFGVIFNIVLKWNVWDYSSVPFNFMGQICAMYSLLWFALSFALIPLCGLIDKLYL